MSIDGVAGCERVVPAPFPKAGFRRASCWRCECAATERAEATGQNFVARHRTSRRARIPPKVQAALGPRRPSGRCSTVTCRRDQYELYWRSFNDRLYRPTRMRVHLHAVGRLRSNRRCGLRKQADAARRLSHATDAEAAKRERHLPRIGVRVAYVGWAMLRHRKGRARRTSTTSITGRLSRPNGAGHFESATCSGISTSC